MTAPAITPPMLVRRNKTGAIIAVEALRTVPIYRIGGMVTANHINAARAIDIVEDYYAMPRGTVRGGARSLKATRARHMAMLLCNKTLGLTYSHIARVIGCHNTTVMAGCANAQALIYDFENYAADMRRLVAIVTGMEALQ